MCGVAGLLLLEPWLCVVLVMVVEVLRRVLVCFFGAGVYPRVLACYLVEGGHQSDASPCYFFARSVKCTATTTNVLLFKS